MKEYVKTIASLAYHILSLLYKYNETVYIEVNNNGNPIIEKNEKEQCKYITLFQNEETARLIYGKINIKAYAFKDLLKELEAENDLLYEVDCCKVYIVRSAFER